MSSGFIEEDVYNCGRTTTDKVDDGYFGSGELTTLTVCTECPESRLVQTQKVCFVMSEKVLWPFAALHGSPCSLLIFPRPYKPGGRRYGALNSPMNYNRIKMKQG